MTKITTRLTVAADGKLSAAHPLPVGEHQVIVEIDARPPVQEQVEPFDVSCLPTLNLGPWPWPEGTTFSREEIYGDDGR